MIDNQELYRSKKEDTIRKDFVKTFKECPIPDDDLMQNLGLFLSSKNLGRIFFMHHIYQLQLDIHGTIMEFGTRWGQNLALFAAMRGIYEPFNRMRKIVGFDTFTGFPELSEKHDNLLPNIMRKGGLACTENYEEYLDKVMQYHEADNPMSHVKRYDIMKGKAPDTLYQYLNDNKETIVSLAFFDFDIYEPTVQCLKILVDDNRLVKGSVIAFDELCDHDSPGETDALREVFDLQYVKLKRLPFVSRVSYFVVGE